MGQAKTTEYENYKFHDVNNFKKFISDNNIFNGKVEDIVGPVKVIKDSNKKVIGYAFKNEGEYNIIIDKEHSDNIVNN